MPYWVFLTGTRSLPLLSLSQPPDPPSVLQSLTVPSASLPWQSSTSPTPSVSMEKLLPLPNRLCDQYMYYCFCHSIYFFSCLVLPLLLLLLLRSLLTQLTSFYRRFTSIICFFFMTWCCLLCHAFFIVIVQLFVQFFFFCLPVSARRRFPPSENLTVFLPTPFLPKPPKLPKLPPAFFFLPFPL